MSKAIIEPIFLMPADSEVVIQFKEYFAYYQNDSSMPVQMSISEDIVVSGSVITGHYLLIALQHYPELINRFILSIDYKFFLDEEHTIELQEMSWKTKPEYQRWFYKLNSLPVWIFFLHDKDARMYALAGDILAESAVNVRGMEGKESIIEFTAEQAKKLSDRLFHSCWFMMLYCHGTGVNAKPYVEALITDYDLFFTAEQVYKKYEADVASGIKLMAKG